jgi:superfamily II DNA or RNA helicase
VGIYTILENDCCNFLAVDFDKKSWKKDVIAFYTTCQKLDIPASIEISRSGSGAHIWIFFEDEISAVVARKLGSHIISETMKTGNLLDLESYDRMFPNQDYMPEGGFGNLIALPLQKDARKFNSSVFVDENLKPYPDQWAYLSFIKKLSLTNIEEIIKNKEIDIPERTIQKKKTIKITISNQIYISKEGLPKYLYHKFIQLAVFPNPEFYIAQASRRSTHRIPRFIKCSRNLPKKLSIPTGLLEKVLDIFSRQEIKYSIDDQRTLGEKIECNFNGRLSDKQIKAFTELINHDMSVLCASTGFGKTVLAIRIICKRNVNTLILVHRVELLNQWKEKLEVFTKGSEIGLIGASKSKQTHRIDVAMIQTLKNLSMNDIDKYGQIIIDECHHIAAYTFENILKKSRAKYILGMTATPQRKDGHHPIVFMQCGDIKFKSQSKLQFDEMTVYKSITNVEIEDYSISLPKLLSNISQYEERNNLIINDIKEAFKRNRKILVLTERVSHLKLLEELCIFFCQNIIVLKGNIKKKDQKETMQKLKDITHSDSFIIIATGKYVGEGFDLPILDTLFLALPVSWKGTLQQYIGRIVRNHENKSSIEVYDYVDSKIERLDKMYVKRRRAYKSLGFSFNKEN